MHPQTKKYAHPTIVIVIAILTLANTFTINSQNVKPYNSFRPGEVWLDTDSTHINAHGGGILYNKGVYYWFGEFKTTGAKGNTAQIGVSCYSSTDLYNWKNEGIVLKVSDENGSEIEKGCVIERPKVIYNKKTKKYVMWFHLELKGKGYKAAKTALAVSNHVVGPYHFVKSVRPNQKQWPLNYPDTLQTKKYPKDLEWWSPAWYTAIDEGLLLKLDFEKGQMSRDMTLFVDDDGKAYHIHAAEENLTLQISELTNDYQNFTGKYIRLFPAGHNEAPAIFKRNGIYYLMASGCTGWAPNAARMFKAKSIWGPWKKLGNPCIGPEADLTFKSQSTYILPVNGKKDSFIYMGDRWQPKNPIDGRYIWLPIQFKNDQPIIKWEDEWMLSTTHSK
ncbi:glycoside hydrolase family 43 protein [Geofilum sp. OHC36d9]|uniref:glycoside hydrolase family 43 protein n=1 Tax=Geofilum sp. OHC36d9 TaxID=3458413 RepID=UPI004033A11F